MTISTDLETAVRSALTTLLQRVRADAPGPWVSDAVADIMKAAGEPSGMVTADGPEAAAALAGLRERAERMTALAAEMLAVFKPGPNGSSARVKQAQADDWQQRWEELQS